MTHATEKRLDTLTHSRLQKFKFCPRAHFYAYEMKLRSERVSSALSEGSAYHKGLEAYDLTDGTHNVKKAAGRRAIAEIYDDPPAWCTSDDDMYLWICSGIKISTLFELHCDYWQNQGLEVIATELEFHQPVTNPETGAKSRTFDQSGKIDRIVRLPDGRVAVQEYKTTSMDIAPESDYWSRLKIDSQISGYMINARAIGHDVKTVLYDVTRKPALRPHRATPMESRKYKKDGTLYANQNEYDETPESYGRRIYEAVVSEPERYFRREEIVRLDADLHEHQYDVWGTQKAIRACQQSGTWPRNTGSCFGFGKCEFFEICTSGISEQVLQGVVPEGFRIADRMHEELDTAG